MAESELPNDLRLWIEETADGRLIQATRRPGGARREAWYVDIEKKNGEVEELFLRLDRSLRSETGDPYSSLRETEVYLALQNTSVPVPAIHGVLKSPQAVLSDRIDGDTWFSQIQDPESSSPWPRTLCTILRPSTGLIRTASTFQPWGQCPPHERAP